MNELLRIQNIRSNDDWVADKGSSYWWQIQGSTQFITSTRGKPRRTEFKCASQWLASLEPSHWETRLHWGPWTAWHAADIRKMGPVPPPGMSNAATSGQTQRTCRGLIFCWRGVVQMGNVNCKTKANHSPVLSIILLFMSHPCFLEVIFHQCTPAPHSTKIHKCLDASGSSKKGIMLKG